MCRLFAFSFNSTLPRELQIQYIDVFKSLAKTGATLPASSPGHLDGWGIVMYHANEGVPKQYKSVIPDHLDTVFNTSLFLANDTAVSGLVHVRKKTIGDTSLPNTHPFVSEKYSFIHNGTISSSELYPTLGEYCGGQTDSERLLKRFKEIEKSEDLSTRDAFIAMILEIKNLYPTYSAINTILHDGTKIYVSRVVNETSNRYSRDDLLAYFTLYVGKTKEGGVLISSEKILDETVAYEPLPNNSISIVSVENGEIITTQLTA